MKGALPWLVRWAHLAGARDCYTALSAMVSPVQNIFFRTVHYFNLCIPIAKQPGKAVVQGRLSLNVCLLIKLYQQYGVNKNLKQA